MKKFMLALGICLLLSSGLSAAENINYTKDIAYDNESQVRVELDFSLGEISVARGQGDYIARINGDYDSEKFKVDVKYEKEGDVGHLVIKVDKKTKMFKFKDDEDVENNWQILLGDMVPLDFVVDAGMAAADFDFTGLKIENISMDIGMASGTLMFTKPNPVRMNSFMLDLGKSAMEMYGLGNANFSQMTIDCGMSSIEMDFSGEMNFDGKVAMDMGMSSTEIVLTDETGVRILSDDGLTSAVDIPRSISKIRKGLYQSDNFNKAKGNLDFTIDVGMGSVDFRLAESL